MALLKKKVCIDDWGDLKKRVSERADAAKESADNKNVTKEFVAEKISEYEQKDKKQSDAVHKEINEKISNLILSDGVFYTKSESDAKFQPKGDYLTADDISTKVDSSDVYSRSEADEIFLKEHQSLSDYITYSECFHTFLLPEAIADKVDASAVYTKDVTDDKYQPKGDYSYRDEVYTKDVTDSKYQPKGDYLTAIDISTKVNSSEVYSRSEADATFLKEHQDISGKLDKTEYDILKENLWNGDINNGAFQTVFTTDNENESWIWNTSDGGGIRFVNKDTKINSFLGTNDGNDASHIYAQMYAVNLNNNAKTGPRITLTKDCAYYSNDMTRVSEEYEIVIKKDLDEYAKTSDIADTYQPKGNYITEHQSLAEYAKTSDIENAYQPKGNYITEHQSLAEYAKTSDIADTYQPKGNYITEHQSLAEYAKTTDVSTALDNKANAEETIAALETKANNSDLLIAKSEYDMLKARLEYLEELISEYMPDAKTEMINDGKIEDLDANNKAVEISEPMKSVHLPEATVGYTVNVPLMDEATVEFTSNKLAYINNTSEEPVSVTFTREVPDTESSSASNAIVYTTGQFETITLENLSVSQKDTETNTVKNVVITENNQKTVSLTLSFADGATITNDSSCPVTIMNKTAVPADAEPISSTIVAPYSTVTISGGQFNVVESTVSDDTLYINKAAHIKKLIVSSGNVIVNDYTLEGHIDEIEYATPEAEANYTVMPKTIDVYTKSDWTKASSTPAIYNVKNDIVSNMRIAPGLFGSNAKINLNGYTVHCSDSNGAFLLRGDSHFIIENGTIDASAYGVWLSGPGIVELKDVTISASAHALYIEKPNGLIFTSGNCYFKVYDDDKTFVANYLDKTYTDGWTTGFHFGEGTKFEDFDPMNSMGEKGGPVNLLDSGFHTVKTTEVIDGVSHDIYTVVKDEENNG